jgi:hypothetical protein
VVWILPNKFSACGFKILFLFGLLVCSKTEAQVDNSFLKHLSTHHLAKEHFAFLSGLSATSSADSVNYLKAKYYLQYENDSLFLEAYGKSKSLFINDSNAFTAANIHFLTRSSALQEIWYGSFPAQLTDKTQLVRNCYFASADPGNTDENSLPLKLQDDFLKLKKSQSKKPWVAGALSAAVPGLGKLYAGRKKSFYFTLLAHVAYGAQSYECVRKLGISHPFSIFSISLFSVFYAANIYGSYQDVKKVKKERRTQFLLNAQKYYYFNYGTSLY